MLAELRSTLEFLIKEWLPLEDIMDCPRYADHSFDSFSACLAEAERIAAERFEPFNRLVDSEPPYVANGKVVLPEPTHQAWKAIKDFGMLSATRDYSEGGIQLPHSIDLATMVLFAAASISISPDALTTSNAQLLSVYGTPAQRQVFAAREFEGTWTGTMCLSEPQAGSSLSDITTRAIPDRSDFASDPLGPRYRLSGTKMWISGGDHELTPNIVHLVLAKTPKADGTYEPGTRSISLFIVPKWIVDANGTLLERNDVTLIGLNHKLGYRGLPNTALAFGDGTNSPLGGPGAIGYLVGSVGDGLRQMFHMMNSFRIKVGVGAAALGFAGYSRSLDYARTRIQGRPTTGTGKNPASDPVPIIQHPDVKRMLLAQKAYSEGALALSLFCGYLLDLQSVGNKGEAHRATVLLEVLTPVVKSWPSEWCLEANSLAIQILGGSGYTIDFPMEQYWRDNRLNMIHEGTHGIQAIDLLGRKVVQNDGEGLNLIEDLICETITRAESNVNLAPYATQLRQALEAVRVARDGAWANENAAEALVNATPFLQGFGHVVIAWVWLDIVERTISMDEPSVEGQRTAMRFFYAYELPKVDAWLSVVRDRISVFRDVNEEWF